MKAYYKLITCLLILGLSTLDITTVNAQGQCFGGGCSGGASYGGALSTTSSTFVAAMGCTYGGEYNTFNVTSGLMYEWSLCPADGASAGFADDQLTLRTTGGSNLCYSDDFCGAHAKIQWTATFTGQVQVLITQYNCVFSSTCNTMVWRQASGGGGYDPCTSILSSAACGSNNTTVITPGNGLYALGSFAPPSQEKIYTYTAPTTGNYSITVVSNSFVYYTDFFYKPVSGGCNGAGWTFIQDVYNAGTSFGTASMTAGTAYYIMVDEEFYTSGGTVVWKLNCPVVAPPNDDCASVSPVTLINGVPQIFTGNTIGATGGTDGVFSGIPTVWHAITTTTCATITLNYCATSPAFGDVWINLATSCPAFSTVFASNWSQSCPGGGSNWIVTYDNLPAGTYWIPVLGNEAGYVTPGPYSLSVTAVACVIFDPCATITPSNLCGVNNTTVIPSGNGAWTNGPYLPPGKESIYTFTPVTTGNYSITQVTGGTGTWNDYFYKPSSGGCNSSGWTFIQDLNGNNLTTAPFSLTAGVQYYFYMDPEGTAGGTDVWRFNCPVAAAPNDNCASAIPLACGATVTGSTTGANHDAPGFPCGFVNNAPDVWYSITVGVFSNVTLSMCGSSYDTQLGVFSGTCGALTQIACNDDFCGLQSQITLTVAPGTYLVCVTGYNGNAGAFTLSATCVVAPPPPPNDDCSAVAPVPLIPGTPLTFTGTTVGSTSTTDGAFTQFPTVWHSFTLGTCADVTLSYCATSPAFADTWINLATACPAFSWVNATSWAQSCSNGSLNWVVQYPNLPAGTYWIPVLGDEPGYVTPGPYNLVVTAIACPPPATNDDCANAIPITCGSITTGSTNGTNSDVTPCGTFAHGVWYTLTLPTSGTVTLSLCGSGYDTWISLFDGSSCGSLGSCIATNDDAASGPCAFTLQSYITTAPLAAGTYYILVAGYSTNMGTFSLDASCALCAVPPVGGTVSGPASGCTGSMVTYTVAGSSSTQWQVSTTSASGPFTDIVGETSPTLNYTPSNPGTYYFQNSASGPGCTPDVSNVTTTTIISSGGVLTTTATPSATACPGTTISLDGTFSTGAQTLTVTLNAGLTSYIDECYWEIRNSSNIVIGSATYPSFYNGIGLHVVPFVTSDMPVTFYITAINTPVYGDNAATYSVDCDATSSTLVSGTVYGPNAFPINTPSTFTSGPLNCVACTGGLTSPAWSGPGGFNASGLSASLPVTPTSGGVYNFTAISCTGCAVSSSVTVTTLASPIPSASSNAPVCDGSSLAFFGDNFASGQSTGNSYSWSGPNGYSASGQFPSLSGATLLATGTYTVTVTNSLGCTESTTTSVTVNPNPVLSVASVTNASCIGYSDGCIDIDATNGAPQYLFDLGGSSTLDGIYCGLAAGTYTVTVIDDNGCESLTNASVIEEDLVDPVINCIPNVTVNNTPNLCSGVATWVGPVGTDNCAGATTSQTGGAVSGSTFPVGITPIEYTVTDVFLNTATCTFNVIVVDNQNPSITCPPDVIVNNTPGFCYAAGVALGNPTTGDNCAVLGVTNNAPAQFPVGATIVDWEVEDLSGNKSQCQQFVIVVDNENPVINGMPSNIVFTASPTDCTPSISWTAPTATDNCSISSFGGNYNPGDEFPEGTTTVIYTALDINGNSVTASFTVTINTVPLVVVASPTVYQCGYNISCNGGNNGQVSSSVTGGCLPYNYLWSTGSTNPNVSGLTAGTYTVTVTDDNGHVTVQTATLTQPPVLNTTLGPDQSFEFACTCANLVPATTGGSTCQPYSYAWSTGATTSTLTVCPTQTATYTVTVTDINGCIKTDAIIIVKPALVAQLDRYVVLGVGTQNDNIGNNDVFNSGAVGHRLAAGSITLSNNGNINTWIAGNNVIIGNNATVATLYRNTASIGNNAVIGTTITPVTLPLTSKVPCFPTFSGGANVNVANGASLTISPGTYNNITTGNNSILRMNAGVYNVNSISTGNGSSILPNGVGVTAKDVIVFVKTTMTTGNQGTVHGNYYSQGAMSLGNGNNTSGLYKGSFLGKPVTTGNNLNFHLDSYCYSTLPLCNVKLEGETVSEVASGIFNLYPNPSNGEFTLQYSGSTGSVLDITIVNTMGQVVYQRKVYEFNGVMEQSFDLGNLGSGIYTLQLHNGNELSNKQFVVTH